MTLTEAQTMLTAVTTAYTAALNGQSVRYQDKAVTRQDLAMLSAEMDKWQRIVAELTAQANGANSGRIRIATWS